MELQELQMLVKKARRRPLWEPKAATVSMGRDAIERILPHRDPFLLLDAITDLNLDAQAICGRRHIVPDDPVFRGHFPGDPVYPGVLQLEIVGQLGLCLIHFVRRQSATVAPHDRPSPVRAIKVHLAHFLSPVRPGDTLTVIGRMLELNDYTGICVGQLLSEGTVCSFGVMEVYLVDE